MVPITIVCNLKLISSPCPAKVYSRRKCKKVVIRFSGDSGDGMQLTGDMFSQSSGQAGFDLTTTPDFPAEIRAPQGSVGGVSSFQIQIGGTEIYTPGDQVDVLVVMNPAALKSQHRLSQTRRNHHRRCRQFQSAEP